MRPFSVISPRIVRTIMVMREIKKFCSKNLILFRFFFFRFTFPTPIPKWHFIFLLVSNFKIDTLLAKALKTVFKKAKQISRDILYKPSSVTYCLNLSLDAKTLLVRNGVQFNLTSQVVRNIFEPLEPIQPT